MKIGRNLLTLIEKNKAKDNLRKFTVSLNQRLLKELVNGSILIVGLGAGQELVL